MKKTELESKLEAYDLEGVPFYEAKKSLLKEGFSEQEITVASASHPFDGKKNEPKAPHPDTELYAKNPELAREKARALMDEDHEKARLERIKASLTLYAGSRLGSLNPISGQGIAQGAYLLGIPLFKLVFLGMFITAILYGMSFTFHLFPLHYVALFIRYYTVLLVLLFLTMVAIQGLREIFSLNRKSISRKKRLVAIASIAFFIALSAYSIVKIMSI